MKRRFSEPLFLLAIAVLFVIANKAAYKGFFQDDDLDTLGWTQNAPVSEYVTALVSPALSPSNFRPVGHGFYKILQSSSDLHFKSYLAAIQVLHLIAAVLVWVLLRSLGFQFWPAAAALVFFVFHPATIPAYWQTMYVFDLLCGLLSVICVLLYLRRQWILSIVCFWLAFKAKEVAIMLPVVLLAYEYLLGDCKWKRLIPFFGVSCLFGVQSLLNRKDPQSEYHLSLSIGALLKTVPFYLKQVFRNLIAGILALLVPIVLHDRRAWFGAIAGAVLFVPLLFLPGRLFSVYCYTAMPFIAILLASIASYSRFTRVAIPLAIFLLWVPMTYGKMRQYRRWALTSGMDNRTYVETIRGFMITHPHIRSFLIDGRPENMHPWGPPGAVHSLDPDPRIHVGAVATTEGDELLKDANLALLTWNYPQRKLEIVSRDEAHPNAAYLDVAHATPFWQLTDGWYSVENFFRWTAPLATAVVSRPADARRFEVTVNVSPMQIERLGPVKLQVIADGQSVGTAEFKQAGVQTVRWPVAAPVARAVNIEFHTLTPVPKEMDPRGLGIAICSFGYKP